jgi:hypothetical protein
MVSTNAIVILVFFSIWTLVEFHTFFSKSKHDKLEIVLELNSVVVFFTSAGIWFFRDRCDGPMEAIENAVLQGILFSPLTFLAARFHSKHTSEYGLLFLSISLAKAIWPAHEGPCGVSILSVTFASICILVSILGNIAIFAQTSGNSRFAEKSP